jgi:GTPase KRas protein
MRETYIRSGEGFLLVYSVTSKSSFNEISVLQKQICRVKDSDNVPMLLVANKCDLTNERVVSVEEGKAMARRFKCRYVETSARLRVNVQESFYYLVREMRKDASFVRRDTRKKKSSKRTCIIL